MSDIVERLRRLPPSPIAFGDSEADKRNRAERKEAADEIEAVRRQAQFAWAAGLFEGEGAICNAQKYKSIRNTDGERRKSGNRWWLVMHSTDHDVLRRFAEIVNAGRFYGPYPDKRSADYKPQLRWATSTLDDAQAVLRVLLPYLGKRRRMKALECLEAAYVRKAA